MINIIEQNGQVVVSSRQVADDFGKRHDSVLRDISNLIISLSTTQNCGMLFIESEYTNSNNRPFKEYLLTRDGAMDVKMTTKWTQKGRVFLYNLLKDNKILPVIEQ